MCKKPTGEISCEAALMFAAKRLHTVIIARRADGREVGIDAYHQAGGDVRGESWASTVEVTSPEGKISYGAVASRTVQEGDFAAKLAVKDCQLVLVFKRAYWASKDAKIPPEVILLGLQDEVLEIHCESGGGWKGHFSKDETGWVAVCHHSDGAVLTCRTWEEFRPYVLGWDE